MPPSAHSKKSDGHPVTVAPMPVCPGISLRERVRQATRQLEAAIILEALEQHRWNRGHTAAALNISYRSLMYKMKCCDVRNAILARKSEID